MGFRGGGGGGVGPPGPAGPAGAAGSNGNSPLVWGPLASTTDGATGDVFDPFVVPVAGTIQIPVYATVRSTSPPSGGDSIFDVQINPGGVGGSGWVSIFTGASAKPTIASGALQGSSTGALATSAVAAGDALRGAITSCPPTAGSMTWRTPGVNHSDSNVASAANVLPTGVTYLDTLVQFFLINGTTVTAPAGGNWTQILSSPLTDGANLTLAMFTRTAPVTPAAETFTFGASQRYASLCLGVGGGTYVSGSSAVSAITTSVSSGTTPSAGSTPVANCITAHIVAARPNAGGATYNQTNFVPWTASSPAVTTDAEAVTNAGSSVNFGLAVGHLVQAAAGAIPTQPTGTFAMQAGSATGRLALATVTFQPTATQAPTGSLISVYIK